MFTVWFKILKTEQFLSFRASDRFFRPRLEDTGHATGAVGRLRKEINSCLREITLTDIMAKAGCNICGCCFFHSPSKASKGSAAEEKAPEVSECQTLLLFTLQIKAISRLDEPIYLLWFSSRYYFTCVSNPVAGPAVLMARGGGIFSHSQSRQNYPPCE